MFASSSSGSNRLLRASRHLVIPPRCSSARPAAAAFCFDTPTIRARFLHAPTSFWNDDTKKQQRFHHTASLYLNTMPRIALAGPHAPLVPLYSFTPLLRFSTATTDAKGIKDSLHSESASSTSLSPDDSTTAPNRTMRQKIRTTAGELRDSAATQLREFRDHPRESATQGAKTVSAMFKKYGPVFVGTYASVYFTTLGLLFLGVQSTILDPVALFTWLGIVSSDSTATTVQLVVDFMEKHDLTRPYSSMIEQHPAFANFAVAWIAVKFTEPVRLPVALTLTPYVSRFLGYTKEDTAVAPAGSATSEPVSDKDPKS